MRDMNMINILIVDDHPLLRQGLIQLIEIEKDIKICGEAADANQAIMCIEEYNPDLVIVDILLDGNVNGIDLIKIVKEKYPLVLCLVLTMYDDSLYAERAIRAGARGYINKKEAKKGIVSAIREVMNGDLYLNGNTSSKIIDKLLQGKLKKNESEIGILSDREFEIFQLIGNGLGVNEISNMLNVSANTIESHRRHIKKKLQITNSIQLAKRAFQWKYEQKI